jgi:hypothetical protein
MNSRIGLLSALVVLQMVLVFIALFAPLSNEGDDGQLLSFAAEQADRLVINDLQNEIEMARLDGGWQVADVPADADKVGETMDKLGSLNAPWPVATSASSAARFEVASDNFQRRVRVYTGTELLAELFLGTSPGYQQVHARAAGSDEIFSVALSNYELGVSTDVWVDKTVFASDLAPTKIVLQHLPAGDAELNTLTYGDEGWLYNGLAADQDAAQNYANRFTTLRVLGLVEPAVDTPPATTLARLTVSQGDAQQIMVVSRVGDEDEYQIAEGEGSAYRLATYVAEQLLQTDANFLPDTLTDGE